MHRSILCQSKHRSPHILPTYPPHVLHRPTFTLQNSPSFPLSQKKNKWVHHLTVAPSPTSARASQKKKTILQKPNITNPPQKKQQNDRGGQSLPSQLLTRVSSVANTLFNAFKLVNSTTSEPPEAISLLTPLNEYILVEDNAEYRRICIDSKSEGL